MSRLPDRGLESVQRIVCCAGAMGRREVHAVAYLLHLVRMVEDFRFTLEDSGPYSYQLDEVIDEAFVLGKVSINSKISESRIWPVLVATKDCRGDVEEADELLTGFEDIVLTAKRFDKNGRLRLAATAAYLSHAVEETELMVRWTRMVSIVEQTSVSRAFYAQGEERHAFAVREAFECYQELRGALGVMLPKLVDFQPGVFWAAL